MTDTMSKFEYSPVDFLFTCLGLIFLLLDIVLDIVAVVSLYEEKEYVSLGVLLLFLVGSSVLVQAFSWLWYSYEDFNRETTVEKCVSVTCLKLLHWLQLGIYFRHAGVVEVSVRNFCLKCCKKDGPKKDGPKKDGAKKDGPNEDGPNKDGPKKDGANKDGPNKDGPNEDGPNKDGPIKERPIGVGSNGNESDHDGNKDGHDENLAVYLSHDLSMLRLIETFSESSPQLVLMLTIMLRTGKLDLWAVLKAIGSASAIACSVTMYHRSLRSFLDDKEKQVVLSSVVYFLWNLLLIISRITALALFASVLPCFIFTHFFCSWIILFFFVWRSKTDFMDNACGEWLYRATVGLIWYFDWFNVVEGRTRYRTLLYHSYILVDISVLSGLWCWKMITEPQHFKISPFYSTVFAVGVVAAYMLGLFLKIIYYKFFHPNLKKKLKGDDMITGDEPDFGMTPRTAMIETDTVENRMASPPEPKRCNKRMRKLAENFYS